MKVVVTEKPSVARDIAKVLKANTKKDGYIEGNGYQITWALGHLVQLIDPDAYDAKYKAWNLADLPIIPETFKTKIIDRGGTKSQFNVIQHLITNTQTEEVICATDAGREGELIFRLIYTQSNCDKPIKRLWISSQTDSAIKEGFSALKSGDDYNPLYDSALSRAQADWLIGMNATRAYSITCSKGQGVMSVGRVQTPVLNMIVQRAIENREFVPETFYELSADCQHSAGSYTGKWFLNKESRLTQKDKAEQVKADVESAGLGEITTVGTKEKREKQPLLYDLTELQKDANKKFKFSADKTLKLMQSLYETHKLLTYPRTSSRYLGNDMVPKLPSLVENLKALDGFTHIASDITENKRSMAKRMIDDKKVSDHHAIIPTDKKPSLSGLSPDEIKIYELVIKRFLAAFLPECVKDHTEIITAFGPHTFKTTGTIIKTLGWRACYQNDSSDNTAEKPKKGKKAGAQEEEVLLPPVQKGDHVHLKSCTLNEGQTKAPAMYNEASILAAMETAGKQIDDEELKEAMKDCGLGTPATRAQILERLITVGYIVREKNKLIPTAKGEFLISSIKDPALLSPELTGSWEKKLNDMAKASYTREAYMDEMTEFTENLVENVSEAYKTPEASAVGSCPKCEDGHVTEFANRYSCSNWQERNCDFVIWKSIAAKTLNKTHVKQLLGEKAQTEIIKGFKSKKGTDFDAALKLDEEFKVVFAFDNSKKVIGKCPVCETGEIVGNQKAYGCSNWKESNCGFTIWKTMASRTITEEEAVALLNEGQTEVLKGFKSRAGKEFEAKLSLVEEKVQFVFAN